MRTWWYRFIQYWHFHLSILEWKAPLSGIFLNSDINVHQYNVRNVDELYVPYVRLDGLKLSLRISGAKLWNVLPNYIRESSSIDIFKQNLRSCLIGNMLLGQTHRQKPKIVYDYTNFVSLIYTVNSDLCLQWHNLIHYYSHFVYFQPPTNLIVCVKRTERDISGYKP